VLIVADSGSATSADPGGGSPHWRASGWNEPPRDSVADVSTTRRRPNSLSASSPPTSSGAIRSVSGRRESGIVGRSIQTTSRRDAMSGPNAARIRSAVRLRSSSEASAARVAPRLAASSPDSFALARTSPAQLAAASRSAASVAASGSASTSIRPSRTSENTCAAASPADRSRSTDSADACLPQRRAAVSGAVTGRSPAA
jgi:hypothetical protein